MDVTLLRLKPLVKELRLIRILLEKWLQSEGVIPLEAPTQVEDHVSYVDPQEEAIRELKERLGKLSDEERQERKDIYGR